MFSYMRLSASANNWSTVATVPRDDVGIAERTAENFGKLNQRNIPFFVPELVVEPVIPATTPAYGLIPRSA